MRLIGVDIGGTATRVGLIDVSQNAAAVIERAERATTDAPVSAPGSPSPRPPSAGPAAAPQDQRLVSLVEWIAAQVRPWAGSRVVGCEAPSAIGVAVAGIVDVDAGVVVRSVNAPFLEGRALLDLLRHATHLPVHLSTDIAAAAWAEYRAASPTPARFGHLRFGTGVGYARIDEGRFISFAREPGRHLDALRVQERSLELRPCPCGSTGCLEAYTSRSALRGVVEAEPSGGPRRAKVIDATRSVVNRLCSSLGPQGALILGGGTLIEHAWLFDALLIRDEDTDQGPASVSRGRCGDDAGLLGAGLLAARLVCMPPGARD